MQICFTLTVKITFGHESLNKLAAMKTGKLAVATIHIPTFIASPRITTILRQSPSTQVADVPNKISFCLMGGSRRQARINPASLADRRFFVKFPRRLK
jgi:hypothetical protein